MCSFIPQIFIKHLLCGWHHLYAWDTSANESEILLSATAEFSIFREDRKGSTVDWEEESWLKLMIIFSFLMRQMGMINVFLLFKEYLCILNLIR